MKPYPTIQGKNNLESLSDYLLGTIPLANKKDLKNGLLVIREKDDGMDKLNNEFRRVRTNLDNICNADTKVIMFTSLEHESGKTFIALNLAMTQSLAGKRIVLLDLDMRKATLSEMISNQEQQGLDSFINRSVQLRTIVKKNYFYNDFDIIPIGKKPTNNPSDFLMKNKERFKELIVSLRRDYDYVFLDSTPLNIVTDADIVNDCVDLTVFIVREGFTDLRKLSKLEKMAKRNNKQPQKLAMILNGSKMKELDEKKTGTFYIWVFLFAAGMLLAGYLFYPEINMFFSKRKPPVSQILVQVEEKEANEDTPNIAVAPGLDKTPEINDVLKPAEIQKNETSISMTEVTPTTSQRELEAVPVISSQSNLGSSKWLLVAGSFRIESNAKRFKKTLEEEGYTCEIVRSRNQMYYRVSIGSFDNLADAEAKRRDIQVNSNLELWIPRR